MCYPVKCEKCGKTTWKGCGKHKDMVMSKVPEKERCKCPREGQAEPVPETPNTTVAEGDHGKVIDIESEKQFLDIISKEKYVAVDFYATWCGPCKAMAPIVRQFYFYILLQFAKISNEFSNIKFIKVNGDDFEEIIEQYDISGYPSFGLFKKGELIDSKSGKMEEKVLKKFIQSMM